MNNNSSPTHMLHSQVQHFPLTILSSVKEMKHTQVRESDKARTFLVSEWGNPLGRKSVSVLIAGVGRSKGESEKQSLLLGECEFERFVYWKEKEKGKCVSEWEWNEKMNVLFGFIQFLDISIQVVGCQHLHGCTLEFSCDLCNHNDLVLFFLLLFFKRFLITLFGEYKLFFFILT